MDVAKEVAALHRIWCRQHWAGAHSPPVAVKRAAIKRKLRRAGVAPAPQISTQEMAALLRLHGVRERIERG